MDTEQARKKQHDRDVKEAAQVINRLADFFFGNSVMTASEIKSARVLLDTIMPRLAAIDAASDIDRKAYTWLPCAFESIDKTGDGQAQRKLDGETPAPWEGGEHG